MVVVDTSVAIKWFLPEEGSDKARALLQDEELAAPDLLFYEYANTLVFKNFLTLADVQHRLRELFATQLQFFVLTEDGFLRTAAVSREYQISAYDASFIALAEKLKLNFITADYKLVQKTKSLPFVRYLLSD